MGVPWAVRLCGSQAFILLQAFVFVLFFWHACSQVGEGFLDRGPLAAALRRAAWAVAVTAFGPRPTAGSSSPHRHSSMELWGAYLLLCLFSLLTQVTTEPPTQKPKKVVNAKKGKEGDRALCHLPGNRPPSP